jgi:hypothetical protein
MIRAIALAMLLTQAGSRGQDLASYDKALASYAANDFDEAVRRFFELSNTAVDADVKAKSEYYLAASFQRAGLPFTALVYFTPIVKAGPKHPFHLKSVEAFVALQELLADDYLVPSVLNNTYDQLADAWAGLPIEVLSRINYLMGRVSYRRGALEDAKQFLEAVPESSPFHARAQYMLGVTLADPRLPAADDAERRRNAGHAVEVFEHLLQLKTPQLDFADTVNLTHLALGRTTYTLGEYARAVEWYEQVPRFSKYWDQALFENGFARFQNDDLGGGLGSLQGLYAPQFAGAFQPESWILSATIYYFACLYEESKAALLEFEKAYLPMAEQLKPFIESKDQELAWYYRLVADPKSDRLPRPVLNWVRANQRMLGLLAMLEQIDREKARLRDSQAFVSAGVTSEIVAALDQNRGTLEQVAGSLARSRLLEAHGTIVAFSHQAEIIRFEVAKAETELAEAGVDTRQILERQTLHRPKMPSERWKYWRFEGEFWRDEIGSYQYTLKRGCPAGR